MQVLTFDFHNTLANCDPWFDLEVKGLPWAVIEHLGLANPGIDREIVDGAYRQLRLDVIASGNEIDAYDAATLILGQYQVRADEADIIATVDAIMRRCLDHMEPVPGAVDTVRHLHGAGVRLGVVSSAVHHLTLEWILDRLGLAHCFEAVITSASCGYYKSTPAIYDCALRTLDGDAASSVHVGDSLKWDVATSQFAGLNAVWLRTPRREAFAPSTVDAVPSLVLSSMVNAARPLLRLLEQVQARIDA